MADFPLTGIASTNATKESSAHAHTHTHTYTHTMLNRRFSLLAARLLKSHDKDALKSTLKFLSRPQPNTISSLFLDRADGADAQHIRQIVDMLNSSLPDVESKRKNVETHYDVLVGQLKQVVEKSIEQRPGAASQLSPRDRVRHASTSEELYQLLLELQLSRKMNRTLMGSIVCHRRFAHAQQVYDNLEFFNDKLDLTVLLCYRADSTLSREIYDRYSKQWIREYPALSGLARKLLWKCTNRIHGVEQVLCVFKRIPGGQDAVKNKDVVTLFQVLSTESHELARGLEQELTSLTNNQTLFVRALRALSPRAAEPQVKSWIGKIVKLSVDNKLSSEVPVADAGVSIYQYRFIKALDEVLVDIVAHCSEADVVTQVQGVLQALHAEESEVKSQMVLKFI